MKPPVEMKLTLDCKPMADRLRAAADQLDPPDDWATALSECSAQLRASQMETLAKDILSTYTPTGEYTRTSVVLDGEYLQWTDQFYGR